MKISLLFMSFLIFLFSPTASAWDGYDYEKAPLWRLIRKIESGLELTLTFTITMMAHTTMQKCNPFKGMAVPSMWKSMTLLVANIGPLKWTISNDLKGEGSEP